MPRAPQAQTLTGPEAGALPQRSAGSALVSAAPDWCCMQLMQLLGPKGLRVWETLKPYSLHPQLCILLDTGPGHIGKSRASAPSLISPGP